MNMDFRLPFITAKDTQGQMKQMQSYMYQLVEQLNHALASVDEQTKTLIEEAKSTESEGNEQEKAISTFASIKELIIKSADILTAYEEAMQLNFDGLYVAQSDFGTYTQETSQAIDANSRNITQLLQSTETIEGQINSILSINAYIRSGVLDNSGTDPIIGVEVGQEKEQDGQTVFSKFARFTAEGVYFYLTGQSDPIAWMTGRKLYITNAEITSSFRTGGYVQDFSNGIIYRWVG